MAYDAASALEDTLAQASILIDDLGWSLYEGREPAKARQNIDEGIRISRDHVSREPTDTRALELVCKGLRHIANIEARTVQNPNDARALFAIPRQAAASLPQAMAEFHGAQIDHSESKVILELIENDFGVDGTVDPTGSSGSMLDEAVALAQRAESTFAKLSDIERQEKVLRTRVRLLAHYASKARFEAAKSQLARIETQVARHQLPIH